MATIGTVTKQKDGRYVGKLKTLSIDAEVVITPVKEKGSEKHPDFQVSCRGVDVGAGWVRKSRTSGKDYVSLSISAPEFGPKTLYANLGRAAESKDPNVFNLIWNTQE